MSNCEITTNPITVVVTKVGRAKTIQVKRAQTKRHPQYGKVMRPFTVFQVHDQDSLAKLGDVVRIRQCRPHSKTKSWELVEVVR